MASIYERVLADARHSTDIVTKVRRHYEHRPDLAQKAIDEEAERAKERNLQPRFKTVDELVRVMASPDWWRCRDYWQQGLRKDDAAETVARRTRTTPRPAELAGVEMVRQTVGLGNVTPRQYEALQLQKRAVMLHIPNQQQWIAMQMGISQGSVSKLLMRAEKRLRILERVS